MTEGWKLGGVRVATGVNGKRLVHRETRSGRTGLSGWRSCCMCLMLLNRCGGSWMRRDLREGHARRLSKEAA